MTPNKTRISKSRTAWLINPRAANSKWLRRKRLRSYLESVLPGDLEDAHGGATGFREKARRACEDHGTIVAMGGDGTIADALQGIFEAGREKDILFGVVPFGSGNAFRKSFGIPKNPRWAIRLLARGVPRPIDLLEIEGRYAAFASIGATARVTGEKLGNRVAGIWGHILAGRRLFDTPRSAKEIELFDGSDEHGPFEKKTIPSNFLDCVVTKTNYFGYSWHIAPRARVDDGYLDVTLFEFSPVRYFLRLPLIYFGLYPKRRRHFKARRVVITGKELPVQFNGEFLGHRERIEIRVVPKAIRMICPPGKRGSRKFVPPASS